MVNFDNELNKVEYIKPMTSGEPGNRIFSIELYTSQKSYKIFVEKEQLISVSEYIIRNLYSINISDSNEENKQDFDYIDEEIKSNNIQIEIQSNNKIFILYFREENETKIFEPSFTTKSSGMGLGLSMIQSIMNAYNGSIAFKTKENQGTTFKVTFPKKLK